MHRALEPTIRPATGDDAVAMARLWFMAFPRMFTKVFGEEAQAFLEDWLSQDASIFGCTSVACADGVPVGFIQFGAGEKVQSGVWATVRRDLRHARLLIGLVRHRYGLAKVVPCLLRLAVADWQPFADDDLFIRMLGVDVAWRGRGIGSRLLAYAEQRAHELGRTRVALEVVSDNTGAKRLYERCGFTSGPERRRWLLRWATDDPSYFRMAKELA